MTRLVAEVTVLPRRRISDDRGWFLKVLEGTEEGLGVEPGEVYFTWALPGQRRGDHFHPIASEWFTVILGSAQLQVEDPSDGSRAEWTLTGDDPKTVFIPPGLGHVFHNASPDTPFLLAAYSNRIYDPTDTVALNVFRPRER